MHLIDRYAYTNRLRRVRPEHKVAVAMGMLVLCLGLSTPLVGVLTVIWMTVLTVAVAQVPAATFGRVLLAEAGFMMLTTVGVMVSIGNAPVADADAWAAHLGLVWVSSSPAALWRGFVLVSRALGCAAAMNFLALTTPQVDLVDLLQRWRMPSLWVDLMSLTYRSIFLLLDSASTMAIAQDSRLGYLGSFRRRIESAALLASQLFIDTYRRSVQMQVALESRGFDGRLRVLPATFVSDSRLLTIGALAGLSLVAGWWFG